MASGNRSYIMVLASLFLGITCLVGCAEGPFWRAGKLSPWARNQWAEEEKIADTLFSKKKTMTESVMAVQNAPVETQQRVAESLADTLREDSVLLTRLHAIRLLGQLDCPAAIDALESGSHDKNSDIRIASIRAWEKMPADSAIPNLQEIIGSDTNVDVRLAATRALGNFSGQRAVGAIGLALNDSDPALQLRAAESLQQVSGESFGRNIQAWQEYVQSVAPLHEAAPLHDSQVSQVTSDDSPSSTTDEPNRTANRYPASGDKGSGSRFK